MTKTYKVANDLGYSAMKTTINNQPEVIQSVIAIQRPQDFSKSQTFDTKAQEVEYFKNLKDHMDVTISSPAINSINGRFFVGKSALNSGIQTRSFDVNANDGKAQSDLSMILTLSRIANQVATDAYLNGDDLSQVLKAKIIMTTGLPIKEGKIEGTLENYKHRYQDGKHLVSLKNFKQPINVELEFTQVYVGMEGEMAQFAIVNADQDLKEKINLDFQKNYPQYANDMSVDEIIQLPNVLGIDIGEGTTDFALITDGHTNTGASKSLSKGYGSALESAVDYLNEKEGMTLAKNREELSKLIAGPANALNRGRVNKARRATKDQLDFLNDDIIDAFTSIMNKNANNVDLIYIHGGGAIPLIQNSDLRQRLAQTSHSFISNSEADDLDIPIITIDESRSRNLNEDGLKLLLDMMTNTKAGDK